jgi:trimeric autotransporter adhesin
MRAILTTLTLLTGLVLAGPAPAEFELYGWAESFALSGGGFGGLQATAGPGQTMVVVPGPAHFGDAESGDTGGAPYMVWDGRGWQVAPSTPGGCSVYFPRDVAMVGSELYVAGNITNLCGTGVDHLARYDPVAQSWVAATPAINASVSAIEWDGNDRLYVGGLFDDVGGTSFKHLFYLQQGTVNQLPDSGSLVSGTNNLVRDIAMGGEGVLVVGDFTTAGGQTGGTRGIASWNPGTESWTMYPEIESGLAVSTIHEVLGVGEQIYIGGGWNRPGESLPENQPSRAAVGGPGGWSFLADDPRRTVTGIASSGGGVFFAADGFDVNLGDGSFNSGPNLAEWAGNWLPLGDNGLPLPNDIDIFQDGKVFITLNNASRGATTANDTLISAGTALYNPTTQQFEPLGQGVGHVEQGINKATGTVHAIAEYNGQIVVGGWLNFAGIEHRCCGLFARDPGPAADGLPWTTLGDFEGHVYALQVFDNALWVGGTLDSAGGIPAASLARYTNGNWDVPDAGLPADISIRALHVHDGSLYAGAATSWGGTLFNSNFLFRWNGSQWVRVIEGSFVGSVVAMATFQGQLHAAGSLPTDAHNANVGRFNGSLFERLGGGISGSNKVLALFNDTSRLVVGGRFTSADGTPARHIATWDGTNWAALGSGLGSDSFSLVQAIGRFRGQLVAAGDFGDRGDGTMNSVSRIGWFDGNDWQSLAGGVVDYYDTQGSVYALHANSEHLWVGGEFDQAGGRGHRVSLSLNIARLENTDIVHADRFE